MKKKRTALLYAALMLFSAAFIAVGHSIASRGAKLLSGQTASVSETCLVKVIRITDRNETASDLGGGSSITATEIRYECEVVSGLKTGERLYATQSFDSQSSINPAEVRPGDLYYVYITPDGGAYTGNPFRLSVIIAAFAVFALLFILFARARGASALFALIMSILSVFLVFVPAILSGRNIYLWALVICFYTVAITPFFVGGFNRKSVAAALGCAGGVAVAAALTALLDSLLRLTGAADEDAMYVALILDEPIDLRAVTFAAILIGALGAALDVSMSIASAVSEMRDKTPGASAHALARSGMNVGRDIIGTQISTLVLAYIGGSLSVVLLLIAYQNSVLELLNLEMVIIELLQGLVGAFTILFVIPATALVSAAMLADKSARPRRPHDKARVFHAPRHDGDSFAGADGSFKIGHGSSERESAGESGEDPFAEG